ncbi:MAG: AgmX/PglI C-terminal domain-containing protein [Myxococcota bacterium]
MRWNVILPPLAAILLAALAFAFWPTTHDPGADDPTPSPAPAAATAPAPPVAAARPAAATNVPAPAPAAATAAPSAAPPPTSAPASADPGTLDPEPDPDHLRALGLTEKDLEPADAGPLHAVDAKGIRSAVQDKLPEIKECYEAWLQQNPQLSGTLKVQFRIAEIPGRDRSKVMDIDIPDGGMGHAMMEGCVKNVFSDLRFETPRGGEARVTYPLHFEARNDNAPPP